MDENNNNENQNNEVIKDYAKGFGKVLFKKVKKWIIICSLCFFGFLLVVGLLHLVEYQVKSIFTNLVNSFNINDAEDAEQISAETNDSVIYIDKNTGKYKLKENYSEKILERLEEQKVNNNVMGFNLEKEEDKAMFKDMIDTYIKAEVATTFPNTGNSFWDVIMLKTNDVEGNITIKRAKTENGASINLEYEKYSSFKQKVEGNNDSVLNKFSINPENFKLCIARRENITDYYYTKESNTPAQTVGGGLTIDELDYRHQLENYAVPLNYLMTMHLISQDVDFMKELVELATGAKKTEPLVLTYVDSQQEHTTLYDYDGEIQEYVTNVTIYEKEEEESDKQEGKDDGEKKEPFKYKGPNAGEPYGHPYNINSDNIEEYYEKAVEYKKQVTKKYSGKLYITKTDTWLKTSERTVNRLPDEQIGPNSIINDVEQSDINLRYNEYESKDVRVDTKQEVNYLHEIETGTIINREFQVVETNSKIIIEDFVKLIEKYPKVKGNLSTSTSNIFYLLQQNENTQKLEKIMRYVLFKINDIDYGVLDKDLDFLLEDEDFIFVSGDTYLGDTIEESIWVTLRSAGYSKEATAAILGNIQDESGFKTNKINDIYAIGGVHSSGHTNKSYTEAVNNGTYTKEEFINDNIGFGLLQWTTEYHKKELYELAYNSGKDVDNLDVQIQYLLKQLKELDPNAEWRTTTDINVATEQLCKELFDYGATINKISTRTDYAEKYLEELKEETGGQPSNGNTIGGYGGTLYSGTYTSTKNRTFTLLNQNTIPGWSQKCNRAAAAIIASGYTQQDAAALVNVINTKYAEGGDTIVPRNNYFNLYGLKLDKDSGTGTRYQMNDTEIISHLKSGGHAMLWMSKSSGFTGQSGTKWTKNIHWVAILEYDEANDRILVADHRGAGWYSSKEFDDGGGVTRGFWRYALISQM